MTEIARFWNGRLDDAARAEVFIRRHPNGTFEVQATVAGKNRLVEHLTRQRAEALAAALTAGSGWRRVAPARLSR
ncbi:hypothetical protein [Longispora fulva]|uniref:Uncharacterized protein n=1 Tax=Longispora fulva TaxID=619741 RepID=A0A8J7GF12_9ACTN|nr:hypothetical protein [Longispora fulva]MBG6136541.1 hypothetical protein [Longispora fulva]